VSGPAEKLVAFVMEDRGIPRPGMGIAEGGEVTSGTLSPMLGVGIGLAYVPAAFATPGVEITIDLRGRPRRARIVRKPFYKREES
jgi:aminomethyltransferase